MSSPRAALLAAPVLACLALSSCSGPDAGSPPAALVAYAPSDALLVVSTDRLDAIRERVGASAWTRFLADERLGLAAGIEKLRAAAGEKGGSDPWAALRAALDALHGGALLYLQRDPGEPVRGALLLDPEGDVAAFRAALDGLLATTDLPAPVDDELAGVAVRLRRDGRDALAELEVGGVVALAFAKGPAIERHALEVIAQLRGDDAATSVLDDGAYAEARGAAASPALEAFLDVRRLRRSLGGGPPAEDGAAHELGLDEIGWAYSRVDVGAGEHLGFALAVELPRSTMIGRLADLARPIPKEMLTRLPADAKGVGFASFDVPSFLSGLRSYLADAEPDALREYERWRSETRASEGFDVEAVARALTGRFATFTIQVPPEEAGAMAMLAPSGALDPALSVGSAYFVELSDVDVVRDAVDELVAGARASGAIETTTVGGVALHTDRGDLLSITWAFLEDGVVVGTSPAPVRAFVEHANAGGLSAADDAAFARAVSTYDDCVALSVLPTATWVGTTVASLQASAAFLLPDDPSLGLDELPLLHADLAPLADEHFDGGTMFGARRDGDRFELLVETR